jgi:single-strand DNA-binding protein
MNRVFLIGNLTRDPEVRYTPSGKAVGDLRLAVNRRYKTADGENKDETCFVNIVVWGRQAETCGEYLRKGSPLLAEGRLQYDEWEKDGQKHNRLRVVAERVQFLSGPRGSEFRDGSSKDSEPRPQKEQPAGAGESAGEADDDNLPF